MNKDLLTLVYPMAFYVFYICFGFIGVFLFRVKGAKSKDFSVKYFQNYADKNSVPQKYLIVERHVDNQFQAPMLFLITCTIIITLNKISIIQVILAWLFVLSRLVHSYIHLTYNNVIHRACAYGLGLLAIVFLWFFILFKY